MLARRYWTAVVTRYCEEVRAAANVERLQFEYELPYVAVARGGQWRKDLMFPGYLLVRVDRGEQWKVLSNTRGIAKLLLCSGKPSRVDESFIQWLRSSQDEVGVVRLSPRPRVGDRAKVVIGTLAGASGVITHDAGERCQVLLSMLGRTIEKTLDTRDLEVA